ncbi:MAG: 23S rRNA pseudouridine(2604) synthase RluF [Lentisphaerales bacterium]|nr:23S rRNA pseudouridine(2604) synthase RluF [Lentisphaerales bacterium]
MDSIRLNKFISSSGFCSRREADKLIEEGRVKVNGKVCLSGTQVSSKDFVEADGQQIKMKVSSQKVYLAVNKPEGITCTTESQVKGNIVDFVNYPEKIFPIGRLDKFSQGLIFMTNDGDIVNKILRAGNAHEKEYIVGVDKPISDGFIHKMSNGIPILNTVTQKCKVVRLGKNSFKIILTQGLNRQIRRMCEYLGYRVNFLQRTRIMNVELGRLKPGSWRNLTASEMDQINKMIADSSNTKEASSDSNKKSFRSKSQKSPYKKDSQKGKKNFKPKRGAGRGNSRGQSSQGKAQNRNSRPKKRR